MSNETDIIEALQEAVRKGLEETANKEIDMLMRRFECRLNEIKSDAIGKFLNYVDITVNPACDSYTVTINVKR